MEKGSCCPPGSWPALHQDHPVKGQYLKISQTTVYHVGEGDRTLIIVTDIFGLEGGRHKLVADTYASYGYDVYIPQLLSPPYTGQISMPPILQNIKNQKWELVAQKFDSLIQHLNSKGKKNFFIASFCWGVWAAFKFCLKYQSIVCIAGFHPSLGIQGLFGQKEVDLANSVKSPSFLYPAGNDPQNIKPNGQIIHILENKFGKEKVGTLEFPQMIHGWVVRGDLKVQNVRRDVQKAIQHSLEYFKKF